MNVPQTPMNILYIGYWNLYDPLTVATIFPSLNMLRELQPKSTLIFVNIQRDPLPFEVPRELNDLKVLYYPVKSGETIFNKVSDFVKAPLFIKKLCGVYNIDVVVARGAPAGSIAYLVWKKTATPFLVESYEPHSDYMLESMVWTKFDVRFLLQRHWERKQKKNAAGLMPVAMNFEAKLVAESVAPEKIKVVPCVIDEKLFAFNPTERWKLRKELGIDTQGIVGLYVGKYDGLYLGEESFQIYTFFFDQLPDFNLIILSGAEYHYWIKNQIKKYKLPADKIFIKSVSHDKVGNYCSASDFGFATIKSYKSSAYCSPIKVGEYWVNGLPVLLTRGVGDETAMIQNGFGGVLFDPNEINPVVFTEKIKKLVSMAREPNCRSIISGRGASFRSAEKLRVAYKYFFGRVAKSLRTSFKTIF